MSGTLLVKNGPGAQTDNPRPRRRSYNNRKPIRVTIEECRGVAQPGSASALGAEGRGFKSLRPDHYFQLFTNMKVGLEPDPLLVAQML